MKKLYSLLVVLPLTVLMATLGTGCPKRAETASPGPEGDDARVDHYAARLEELRARVQAQEPSCSEWRSLARDVCDLSQRTCEISGRHPDRPDLESRCIAAQEECARFNDSAAACR
jgi:hypothetical protein